MGNYLPSHSLKQKVFFLFQLGETEGRIKDLEVWGVGPEPQAEQGRGTSVLDLDPEVQVDLHMLALQNIIKK